MSQEIATLGAGCFWCVEAVFSRLDGVHSVKPGYCGGATESPTYEQVCTGSTGHAEVLQVVFDPDRIPFSKLLEVFFKTHDPTTKDRQGEDVGTQYRSSIFCSSEDQRELATQVISQLNGAGAYASAIVTEVGMLTKFWEAENYHQDYFANNPENQFCQMVIQPKIEKFKKIFSDILIDKE